MIKLITFFIIFWIGVWGFVFALQTYTLWDTHGQCDQGYFVCYSGNYGCLKMGNGICDGIHDHMGVLK